MTWTWLQFLGKRRPKDLSDQHTYDEVVSRPKAEPVKHDDPRSVTGHHLGAKNASRTSRESTR